MIDGNRVLAVIAARGESKGLHRKNVLEAGGRPLIAWSIEAASGSRLIDRFLLSSDDDEIIRVAQRHGCGCPFKRPAALATDTAAVEDAFSSAQDSAYRLGGTEGVRKGLEGIHS